MKRYISLTALALGVGIATLQVAHLPVLAQGAAPQGGAPAGAPRQAPPPLQTFDTTKPTKLDLTQATARYRVKEQLVGVDFLNDAVGSTSAVTGTIVVMPDGKFGPQSKLVVDLKTLTSDQELRDGYIRNRVLETEKFPTMEFVPTAGLAANVPSEPTAKAIGFKMVGNMTLKGVTKPVTWNVAGTLRGAAVAGVATTQIKFSEFNLPKPAVPLLLSAEDTITLEVEFRAARSVL
ncbi:MAG: YceI family protein [Vicinamibacterales bacterium]